MSRWLAYLMLGFGTLAELVPGQASSPARRNVLLLSIDDLRPSLGCMGDGIAQTPHIDRLGAQGLVFERHYCQLALCNPSRSNLMTGLRPRTIKVMDLGSSYRKKNPDLMALPQLLRLSGYRTMAIGKVHHNLEVDDPLAWSEPSSRPARRDYHSEESLRAMEERAQWLASQNLEQFRPRGPAFEAPDIDGRETMDGRIASDAVAKLRELAEDPRPFFLAVGFLKPHLPLVAPKDCWDRYDPEGWPDPPTDFPKGTPAFVDRSVGELRAYVNIPAEGPLSPELARQVRHAYYACVSHVDDQVGRVMGALEELGLAESTAVVLWSDHGFQLGELGQWCKHSNFETAVRSPLIFRVPPSFGPGFQRGRSMALVETVDLYPTIVELCGILPPEELEGQSFLPVLRDPARPWKEAVYSEYSRYLAELGRGALGVSVRTAQHRLTLWRSGREAVGLEFYTYGEDLVERENLAEHPDHERSLRQTRRYLGQGWQYVRDTLLGLK